MTTPTPSRLAAALGTAPATREKTPYEVFRAQIGKLRKDIEAMVGKEKLDTFIRVCLNAVQYNPSLLEADRKSLFIACMEAAQDGLMPDGSEAVFNVYGTKNKERTRKEGHDVWEDVVQYLPMAYGLVQKIYESGATKVDAVAVYKEDHFKYRRGDNAGIDHEPYGGDKDPGPVVAAYCIVEYPQLATKREVMFRRDIEKVREKSKAKGGLMWGEFYDQAAIKSVIHRIWKQLPKHDRLTRALMHDNKATGIEGVDVVIPTDEAGTNLELLVDMRVEQEMRDTVLGGIKKEGATVEGAVTGKTEDRAAEREVADPTTTHTATSGGVVINPLPKPGDPGTPELKAKLLGQMDASTSTDTLDIVQDEVRFFKWSIEDATELKVRADARRKALGDV